MRKQRLLPRMRPPDSEIRASMESRLPLRDEKDGKPVKRESRLGLRSIFARRRGISEMDDPRPARDVATPGMRETMHADSSTSYGLQCLGMQSETHLAPIKADGPPTRPRTSALRSPTFVAPKSPLGNSHKKKGSLATWDPIPLCQAYPQAIRTAILPACVQGDALLRVHNKRETMSTGNISHPDFGDQKAMFVDMARKKHRRNSSTLNMEWTTKVYILTASGYLLQYAGEGTNDRLPEKAVHLCKDSAAFASDVIPGRHWVLQVSAIFEECALMSHDTRSLFGKFGMREKEKRQAASDILMVFENAEDMENWMTLLRREIESLGGKRSLTETGAPREVPDDLDQLQPCQRLVAVREPFRFASTTTSPGLEWDTTSPFDGSELPLDTTLTDLSPGRSFDDNSTTNSFVSQDGHQLEGLRDSSNRFSFMSATRTIVTSDSSPSNSPLRDSFGSQVSDSDDATPLANEKTFVEVRRRPNASEIDDRRKSYRTSNIFLEHSASQPAHRVHASLSSIQEPPNFSLPQPRRRTVSSGDPVHMAHVAPVRPPRRLRRPPPSSLGLSRPLSIVADSPSPSKSPLETNDSANVHQPLDSSSMCTTWMAGDNQDSEYESNRESTKTSLQISTLTRPRNGEITTEHAFLRPIFDFYQEPVSDPPCCGRTETVKRIQLTQLEVLGAEAAFGVGVHQ
ncbi:translation initiation factor eIF3 subunit g [Cytospora paraplurivora]|uniref:Translation initiation factor eIF3 subunit g n=1 Tax=Cytospora paraplurivora TaxID=2898453 RepID=A0AAN9YHM6_9PEZI